MTDFERGCIAGYSQALKDIIQDIRLLPCEERNPKIIKIINTLEEHRWKGQ